MLEVFGLNKTYPGGNRALDGINLEMRKGEMAFITGHSGSGKSTLLKIISGEESCSDGRVLFQGQCLTTMPARRWPKIRRKMGIISQDFKLLMHQSVRENISIPLEVVQTPGRVLRRRVDDMLEEVNLSKHADKLPSQLSAGQRQRVVIARALINDPLIVLADEPTGHLDPEEGSAIAHLLEDMHQKGATILVATHDHHWPERLGQRPIYLHEGRILENPAMRAS
ncbi:MAG: cell division ATP-binding protein FtsE [Myxococcales bacterium]|nr:cell division ATP-binding protein FtsE [Myxococcales bacterium]